MSLAGWWRRNRAAGSGVSAAASTVLSTARRAQEDAAREQAQRRVLELGDMLGRSSMQHADGGTAFVGRALDAYAAGAKVLDSARDIAD